MLPRSAVLQWMKEPGIFVISINSYYIYDNCRTVVAALCLAHVSKHQHRSYCNVSYVTSHMKSTLMFPFTSRSLTFRDKFASRWTVWVIHVKKFKSVKTAWAPILWKLQTVPKVCPSVSRKHLTFWTTCTATRLLKTWNHSNYLFACLLKPWNCSKTQKKTSWLWRNGWTNIN